MDPNIQLPSPTPTPNTPPPSLPTPGNSPSYLDQIAAKPVTQKMNPIMLWGFIGGVLLILGIMIIFLLNTLKAKTPEQLTQFVYRVEALQSLTDSQADNVQASSLVALNGNLGSILAGIHQESVAALESQHVKKLGAVPPKSSSVAIEYTSIASRLDDARLNAVFDRTYVREVTYQLEKLRAEIQTMKTGTHSKAVLDFLQTSDTNLKPLETAFSSYVSS